MKHAMESYQTSQKNGDLWSIVTSIESFKGLSPRHIGLGIMLLGLIVLPGCSQEQAVYQPAVAKLIASADAMKKANQPGEAICRLKAAAEIAPETFQVQYNLGVLYSEAGQWPSAIEHLKKALTISPDEPNALYTLGFTYEALGDKMVTDANAQSDTSESSLKGEMTAQAKAAYTQAAQAYQAFLKVAPKTDTARADVESQLQFLQSKV